MDDQSKLNWKYKKKLVSDHSNKMAEDLKSMYGRLATFKNFPISAAVRPRDLADAGFYYNGNGDDVICAFDGCELGEWEAGDVPMREHGRHYPGCSFVAGKMGASNVADACNAGRQTSWGTVSPGGQSLSLSSTSYPSINSETMLLSLQETDVDPRGTTGSVHPPTNVPSTEIQANERSMSTADEIQSYMDTEVIQMLITEKECKAELMRTVCENFISEKKKLPKAEKLMEAYWVLEEAECKTLKEVMPAVTMETRRCEEESLPHQGDPPEAEREAAEDESVCATCASKIGTIAFVPCGHVVCCNDCADEMDTCPACGMEIIATRPAV